MTDAFQSPISPPNGFLSPESDIPPAAQLRGSNRAAAGRQRPHERRRFIHWPHRARSKEHLQPVGDLPRRHGRRERGRHVRCADPGPHGRHPGRCKRWKKPTPIGERGIQAHRRDERRGIPLTPNPSVSRLVIPGARKTVSNPAPGAPRLRFTVHRGAVAEPGFQ